ncbi:MAG TPA: hypothetical protein VKU80_09865, partial [Planctomycetota bacterium]|nr:hypothetical protein [Planctomycetota bacterium]
MAVKEGSALEDDGASLQLVSEAAPFFYDPNRDIQFNITPPEILKTRVVDRLTPRWNNFERNWNLSPRILAAKNAAAAYFEATENLRLSEPEAYHVIADASLRKPDLDHDPDSCLGLKSEADRIVFRLVNEPRALLDAEWEQQFGMWPRVSPNKLASVRRLTSRVAQFSFDVSDQSSYTFFPALGSFETFDAEAGVIRTGIINFGDDDTAQPGRMELGSVNIEEN